MVEGNINPNVINTIVWVDAYENFLCIALMATVSNGSVEAYCVKGQILQRYSYTA